MDNLFISETSINALNTLKKYKIEFGVFTEDGSKIVEVDVLNPDETLSKVDMSIGDIMYFTENGTITIPGKYILEKCLQYSQYQLELVIDSICYNVLQFDKDEIFIENELKQFIYKFEAYIKSLFISTVSNINKIGSILQQDDNKYVYDLTKLSKYIKCKLIKNE